MVLAIITLKRHHLHFALVSTICHIQLKAGSFHNGRLFTAHDQLVVLAGRSAHTRLLQVLAGQRERNLSLRTTSNNLRLHSTKTNKQTRQDRVNTPLANDVACANKFALCPGTTINQQ